MLTLFLLKCLSRGENNRMRNCEYKTHTSHTYQYKACGPTVGTSNSHPTHPKTKQNNKKTKRSSLQHVGNRLMQSTTVTHEDCHFKLWNQSGDFNFLFFFLYRMSPSEDSLSLSKHLHTYTHTHIHTLVGPPKCGG